MVTSERDRQDRQDRPQTNYSSIGGSWLRQILRGCSPNGTVRMCSFWMSSMVPMTKPSVQGEAHTCE